MSTDVLHPIVGYFSPIIQVMAEPLNARRKAASEPGGVVTGTGGRAILGTISEILAGAVMFVFLLLPSLLLLVIGHMVAAGSNIALLVTGTSQVLMIVDLLLFSIFALRSFQRALWLI